MRPNEAKCGPVRSNEAKGGPSEATVGKNSGATVGKQWRVVARTRTTVGYQGSHHRHHPVPPGTTPTPGTTVYTGSTWPSRALVMPGWAKNVSFPEISAYGALKKTTVMV